jgi:hypothetical protein
MSDDAADADDTDAGARFAFTPAFDSWSIGVVSLELLLGTPHVFSVDSRTSHLLRSHLLRAGSSESEIDHALLLAALSDYCLFAGVDEEKHFWPATSHATLEDAAVTSRSCGLLDFRRALQQRDQAQTGEGPGRGSGVERGGAGQR